MIAVHEQGDAKGQYVMWSGTTEGEGFDRTHLRLPGSQEELIKVCSVCNTETSYAGASTGDHWARTTKGIWGPGMHSHLSVSWVVTV